PFHVTAGELIAGHSDQPYACTPATVSHFRFRALSIPPDAGTDFTGSARDLAIAPLDPDGDRYSRLIAAAFSALFD
uniref:hypothetical protein n=1 Tax=Acinetobacter baumannii TaxID=470 RepID=UPI001C092B26